MDVMVALKEIEKTDLFSKWTILVSAIYTDKVRIILSLRLPNENWTTKIPRKVILTVASILALFGGLFFNLEKKVNDRQDIETSVGEVVEITTICVSETDLEIRIILAKQSIDFLWPTTHWLDRFFSWLGSWDRKSRLELVSGPNSETLYRFRLARNP